MNKTSIEWLRGLDGSEGFTWNPTAGCSPVSSGCANCWASRLASTRLQHLPEYAGVANERGWNGNVIFFPHRLAEPLRKRKPSNIAVPLMGDLYHESVPFETIAAVYGVMAACPQHIFFVLTKRPERRREFHTWLQTLECDPWTECHWKALSVERDGEGDGGPIHCKSDGPRCSAESPRPWPLPNVAEGVSTEDQTTADARIPELLQTPAAFRWVSAEPLLDSVDLREVVMPDGDCLGAGMDNLGGEGCGLDFVAVGGEAGPHSRPCNVEWIRSIVRQCKDAGVDCMVKQLGANSQKTFPGPGNHTHQLKLRDRAGSDPTEWPADLRIQQLPRVRREERR